MKTPHKKRWSWTPCLLALLLLFSGCRKADIQGKWRVILNWDERSVTSGPPPPPTIVEVTLRDGRIYRNSDNTEVGVYFQSRGMKIRLKISALKVILYGKLLEDDRMEGDISYFPVSEFFGTFIAARTAPLAKPSSQ